MSNKNLSEIVLQMEQNVQSITGTTNEILNGLKTMDKESVNKFGEPVLFFLESVTKTVLDWMGTGQVDRVRDLIDQMNKVIVKESEDIYCLESLSPNRQLTVKLLNLRHFMAIFLKTNNLSKYAGLLTGERHASWREALKWIYEHDQPVRPNDLVNVGIFNRGNTASNALDQLSAIGLLEKQKSKSAIYEITWAGRSVYGAILQNNQSRRKDTELSEIPDRQSHSDLLFIYVSAGQGIKCRDAQKKINKYGYFATTDIN